MPKFVDEIVAEVADLHELWCDADAMMREFYRCHLAGEAPSKEFLEEVNEYITSLAEEG